MLEAIKRFLAIEPMQKVELSSDFPDIDTQIAAATRNASRIPAWQPVSIAQALGYPAIQRAVTLISATTGSLAMQGFAGSVPMTDTPRVLQRPNPFETPRDSYRDMAFGLATRGECVLWIAHTDAFGKADSLVNVPLAELQVEPNPRNRLYPIYRWGDVTSTRYSPANPDGKFVHITYLKEHPLALRGVGPLQMCRAAVSVAVEAQEWAANFYGDGGHPSYVIKAAGELGTTKDFDIDGNPGDSYSEADLLRNQWTALNNNVPRVIDEGIDSIDHFPVDPSGSQMLAGREYQNGDAARMFGIPGTLLDYMSPGSSLTYQTVEGEYTKFVRTCLAPNYLEPIEQAFTDLLPRQQVARFYVDGLLRADIKTRFDVYNIGVPLGIIPLASAKAAEGYGPGNIEVAPVLPSAPASVPTILPDNQGASGISLHALRGEVRCTGLRMLRGVETQCNRLLAESGPFVGTCPRCKTAYPTAA